VLTGQGLARRIGGSTGHQAVLFCLVAGATLFTAEAMGQDVHTPTIRITPATIEKTSFYNGCHVRIEGCVRAGTKPVIVIRGPERAEAYTKKRHLGPIWLNSGRVQISAVPSVFLSFSAEPIERILDRTSIDQYQLDGEAIVKHIKFEPDQGPKDELLAADYLALRIRDGRYRFEKEWISTANPENELTPFSLEFDWPKAAPSANYEVWLCEVRDGTVLGFTSVPLQVTRVGFPAWIANLSNNHASEYGIMSVLIAAMAGFGIDLVVVRLFGKRRAVGR
jgi:putative transmembrane protein Alph_Pro_TM